LIILLFTTNVPANKKILVLTFYRTSVIVNYNTNSIKHQHTRKEASMHIVFNDNSPIYQQIMWHIKSEIASGNISAGNKIPSIRELSKLIQTNPNTIMRAYQELEREGVIFNKRGEGAFVTEDAALTLKHNMAQKYILDFITNMQKLNISTTEILQMLQTAIEEA
jgi:DNA-binding transcriptional regulator YhcF (GntR family)